MKLYRMSDYMFFFLSLFEYSNIVVRQIRRIAREKPRGF